MHNRTQEQDRRYRQIDAGVLNVENAGLYHLYRHVLYRRSHGRQVIAPGVPDDCRWTHFDNSPSELGEGVVGTVVSAKVSDYVNKT